MAQAFVTGGSGFIGQVLVRRLVAAGHTTRVLVRSEAAARTVTALGAEPVAGDLTDPAAWRSALQGSDVVFHLAAETDITAPRERHQRVTVDGTRAAVEAARQAGVPRFVYCGSEAALLAGEPLLDVDETAPLRPDSAAAYCATKAAAEQIVLDASSADFATVSIRPRFVWGPHSNLVAGLVEAARTHQFAWIDGGRWTTDITYVDNAVEGLMLGWQRGTPGRAYFVTDLRRVVLREFLEAQFALHDMTEPVPDIDAATADAEIPVPARWFLGQDCTLRTDRAVAELGYQPVVPYEAAMSAVRESLHAAGPSTIRPINVGAKD